jgi:hypothetical protein
MSSRGYDPLPIARAALKRGALTPAEAGHYRFGRRVYGRKIVNALIEAGEALRLEDGRVIGRASLPVNVTGGIFRTRVSLEHQERMLRHLEGTALPPDAQRRP